MLVLTADLGRDRPQLTSRAIRLSAARDVEHSREAEPVLKHDSAHERIGDLILHLLRTAARPVGKDDHLVVAQVRDCVHGTLPERPVAPTGDAQIERDS